MTTEVLVAENVELPIGTLSKATKQGASLSRWEVIEAVVKALNPEDRKRLEAYIEGDEPIKVYECICGTTFKEEDGEHKYGYLVCPSCWSEDLREVTNDGRNDNEAQ